MILYRRAAQKAQRDPPTKPQARVEHPRQRSTPENHPVQPVKHRATARQKRHARQRLGPVMHLAVHDQDHTFIKIVTRVLQRRDNRASRTRIDQRDGAHGLTKPQHLDVVAAKRAVIVVDHRGRRWGQRVGNGRHAKMRISLSFRGATRPRELGDMMST